MNPTLVCPYLTFDSTVCISLTYYHVYPPHPLLSLTPFGVHPLFQPPPSPPVCHLVAILLLLHSPSFLISHLYSTLYHSISSFPSFNLSPPPRFSSLLSSLHPLSLFSLQFTVPLPSSLAFNSLSPLPSSPPPPFSLLPSTHYPPFPLPPLPLSPFSLSLSLLPSPPSPIPAPTCLLSAPPVWGGAVRSGDHQLPWHCLPTGLHLLPHHLQPSQTCPVAKGPQVSHRNEH